MHRIYIKITNKFNSFLLAMKYVDLKLCNRNITKEVVALGLQEGGNSTGRRTGGEAEKSKTMS
jgi:hypothetical protein